MVQQAYGGPGGRQAGQQHNEATSDPPPHHPRLSAADTLVEDLPQDWANLKPKSGGKPMLRC